MHPLPFALPGRFWRGNLHTHTTNSDGFRSTEQVCAFYRAMGYDFLSITDHFMAQFNFPITDARAYESADFITIPGAELHTGRTLTGEPWHILANGIPFDFAPPTADETGPQIAARALAAGAFVTCAHPAWYALSEAEVLSLGPVHAIETINGISLDHSDRIDSWYMLDALTNQGHRYLALTTDDAHFHPKHNDRLLGWTMVKSETLSAPAILDALKRGAYYSSSGPILETVEFDGRKTVYIRCSPVDSIFITGRGSKSVYHHGNGMVEAELGLERLGDSAFCRVTVRDDRSRHAWTNVITFED
ncbi:MAG: CehA/McbA family metallohydrolase [Pleurocapsa minor GSE-CHR-MK-17-07R]|jgi:hypothetical protein|nr:CehA/McbA family metallohydrolase [Pleurocapsa minor GSE-CHR-MK 17-07R]